jgi:hypothetical protein
MGACAVGNLRGFEYLGGLSLVGLLMQAEITVDRSDGGNGVLVDQDVAIAVQQYGKIVEGFDVAFHFVAGHHVYDNLDPFFAGLIEVLILNIERCFCHVMSPRIQKIELQYLK